MKISAQRGDSGDQQVVVGAVLHVLVRGRGAAEVDLRPLQRRALDRFLGGLLDGVDVRDAFWRHRIALVADDEPHRLAVGRDEVLHAALEVGVVEDLRRQIERVVVLRRRRTPRPWRSSSPASPPCWSCMPFWVWHTSSASWSSWSSWSAIMLGHQRDQLRHQRVQPLHARAPAAWMSSVMRVDAVEGVEDRPDRPADRDVEAVRFPVEVVAQRPEEVVEVRRCCRATRRCRRSCPSSCATISCVTSAICCVSADIFSIVSMVVCISSACLSMSAITVLVVLLVHLSGVVPCMLIWNGIEVCSIGVALRPGDRLHPRDAGHLEDAPWRSCR